VTAARAVEIAVVTARTTMRPVAPNLHAMRIDNLRIEKGRSIRLARISTDATLGLADKAAALAQLAKIQPDITELQTRLHAEGKRGVLLVIQAMDAGGKDGAVRGLHGALNPTGVRVVSFKVPAGRETEQDYLWRVHNECPRKGEIVLFNRSHYEDVLVVRVREFVAAQRWKKRYQHIANFEQMLADEGTEIIKIFLHISKEEQRVRQQERIDIPQKNWKFRVGDLEDRARWDNYMAAYQDAINKTSTPDAPWYVVPADRKWVRDVAVATILLQHLKRINPQYPPNPDVVPGMKVD
jgi:PPK2 family polyphosphate:nucleotide phosphotransferase